jgi:hypothetical protein
MKKIEKSKTKQQDKNNDITVQENEESSNFKEYEQGNNDEKQKSNLNKLEKTFDSKGSEETEKDEEEDKNRINGNNNAISHPENEIPPNFEGCCRQGYSDEEQKRDDLYKVEEKEAIDLKGKAGTEKDEKEENTKKNQVFKTKPIIINISIEKVIKGKTPKIKNKGNAKNEKSLGKNSISSSPSSEKKLNDKIGAFKNNVDRNSKAQPTSLSDKNKKENKDDENEVINNRGSISSIVVKKTYPNYSPDIQPKNLIYKYFCNSDNSAQNISKFTKAINGKKEEGDLFKEKMKSRGNFNLMPSTVIKKTYSYVSPKIKKQINLTIKYFDKSENSAQNCCKIIGLIHGKIKVEELIKEKMKNNLKEREKLEANSDA